MKVVVAIDSFKGSLSSLEAGEAIREGVLKADKDAEVVIRPLADGGEGTVEALAIGLGGDARRKDNILWLSGHEKGVFFWTKSPTYFSFFRILMIAEDFHFSPPR